MNSTKATDIVVKEIEFSFEDFLYRSPIKFGGVALDRVTVLNVACTVESRPGQIARGHGSMPLGNVWSYPSKKMPYADTLAAMKAATAKLATLYRTPLAPGHPIDITHQLDRIFPTIAHEVATALNTADPMPLLAVLVCASPFDASLHDAFGKMLGLNCYRTYSRDFLSHDLGHYLGAPFNGLWLENYISPQGQATMPLYHLVGALDPLDHAEVSKPIGDGLPETLGEWIHTDGLTHLKIKLNGNDLAWDVARVLKVNAVSEIAQAQRGISTWFYSLDFNEQCPHVQYLIDFLAAVQDQSPQAFARIQYIEQPTKRDLKADRANLMHRASAMRPVVIDESLIDLESLQIAQEMGYTGAALKACKGQTQSLLMAAAAQHYGLFLCVQDLTCPGASLIHSAGLAAHIPGIVAIESNARQYCPGANAAWASRFPGMFHITNGTMQTSLLNGPGLGT